MEQQCPSVCDVRDHRVGLASPCHTAVRSEFAGLCGELVPQSVSHWKGPVRFLVEKRESGMSGYVVRGLDVGVLQVCGYRLCAVLFQNLCRSLSYRTTRQTAFACTGALCRLFLQAAAVSSRVADSCLLQQTSEAPGAGRTFRSE